MKELGMIVLNIVLTLLAGYISEKIDEEQNK
jgi:hypothetical protein